MSATRLQPAAVLLFRRKQLVEVISWLILRLHRSTQIITIDFSAVLCTANSQSLRTVRAFF